MYFCAARAATKLPLRCVLITPSQSSSDILKSRLSRVMPASATRMSSRPRSCAARATAAGYMDVVGGRASNLAVARLFEEIARSLEVSGQQGHRLRAYRRAARAVAGTPESIEQLAAEGRLRDIPGIGPAMAALIGEF